MKKNLTFKKQLLCSWVYFLVVFFPFLQKIGVVIIILYTKFGALIQLIS